MANHALSAEDGRRVRAGRVAVLVAAVALAASALTAACGEGAGPQFEAPSADEMRERVHQEATAILDADTMPWAWEQTIYAVEFATAFLHFTRVYAASFSGEGGLVTGLSAAFSRSAGTLEVRDGTLATTQQALTYTASGYISFSCPGPDLAAPDYEFGNGDARVDSPGVVALDDIATVEVGSVFRLRFQGGCLVGADEIGGDVFGLFETPWVLAADVTEDFGDGARRVRADIELAANRFTVILYDDADRIFKVIVTHPEGSVTSARFEGVNAKCTFGIERDPASGGYELSDEPPSCDF